MKAVAAADALAAGRNAQPCTWTQSSDPDMPDTYITDCGEMWSFTDGGPADNNVRYCHSCGKPVVEVKNEEGN